MSSSAGKAAPLPTPPTALVGRERETAAVAALLGGGGARLVTLTGPGGVGKTRLALRVAAAVAPAFPDGVRLVELAPVADPALVPAAVARAVGAPDAGGAPWVERLTHLLRDQRLLLVLDNVEQVVEAAPFVAALLAACPGLAVLATSRVRLRLSGEREVAVPPLALPDDPAAAFDRVAASAAVQLFVARARDARGDFRLDEGNAAAVAELCRRLDGLPLAIELAAAWAKVLPPAGLLARLERRLPMLTGGGRDLPDRQRTMRDAVAWSHDLLPADEQALFARLSVFVGGFALAAAEAVVPDDGGAPHAVLAGVASLVDKSLLRPEPNGGGEPRFGMLETVREFGQERLDARRERVDAARRHAAHFLALAEAAEAPDAGGEQVVRLDRLAGEHDNLRAAFAWLAAAGPPEDCLRLAVACAPYWYVRGHIREAWTSLNRAIAAAGAAATPTLGHALNWTCQLAMTMGDLALAGDRAERGRAVWRAIGDPRGEAAALHTLALVEENHFRWAAAEALYREELAVWRDLGDPRMVARALALLGGVAYGQGDGDRAVALVGEAAALLDDAGDRHWGGLCAWYLGMFAAARGRHGEAARHHRTSLQLLVAIGDSVWRFKPLVGLAAAAAATGRAADAARLLGAADAVLRRTGARLLPFDVPIYERAEAAAGAALGAAELEAARRSGTALPAPELLALADAVVAAAEAAPRPAVPQASEAGLELTAREREVLLQVAEAKTNPEIAAALFVSPRTVDAHVANILAKLEVGSRRAAVARGRELGLLPGAPRYT